MLKQWILCISATIAVALPGAGQASEGRIGFIGAITAPTCTLVVSDIGTSAIANAASNEDRATLTLSAAAGEVFRISAADCGRAVDAAHTGAAPLVSIYFESIGSAGQRSGTIIDIVYQ